MEIQYQENLKEEYAIDKHVKPNNYIENYNAFKDLTDVNDTIQSMYDEMNLDRKPKARIYEVWIEDENGEPKKPELVPGIPPRHNTSSSKFMERIKEHDNFVKSQATESPDAVIPDIDDIKHLIAKDESTLNK